MPATPIEITASMSASELVKTARLTPLGGGGGGSRGAAGRPPFCAASDAASSVQSASDAALRGTADGSGGADGFSDSLMLLCSLDLARRPMSRVAPRGGGRARMGRPSRVADSRRSAGQKPRAASVLVQAFLELGELAPAH